MDVILLENVSRIVKNSGEILENQDLLLSGGTIEAIGPDLGKRGRHTKKIDCRGKIAAPGFINPHTHLYQNMLKGMRDDLGLKAWCETVTFPFAGIVHNYEHEGNFEAAYYYGMLGALEMIHSGITTFVDMDIMADTLFEAWEEAGVRGIGAIQAVNRWVPKALMIPDEERKKRIEGYIQKWHNRGLLKVSLAPSTPFACTPDFLEWLKNTAEDKGLTMFIHVAETRWEVEQSIADCGATPLAYLDSVGFLSRPFCAVHGVHLTKEETALARDRNVTICYNPKSNAKLGSGVAPVGEFLKNGIPVCISTDGAASNDLLDIFEDMRFGAMLQKAARQDPLALGARAVYDMATVSGAKLLGMEAGVLETGSAADIIILDSEAVHFAPVHDVIQQIVYCGKSCDVETVIVNGVPVMENRVIRRVDEKKIRQEAAALTEKLCSEIKIDKLEAEF
jgi:5-methylthioadenosine/S-adenosylhomocysteine deaminase